MKNNQNGFSLIELLLVVVIIGVIASIAIPSLMKARGAAENASAFSTLRTMSTLQVKFYSQNGRFGRLDEINNDQSNTLGTYSGTILTRGKFTYQMDPVGTAPLDTDLKNGYKITATRSISGSETPYVVYVDQSGSITSVLP